jgi:hypothetical protein
MTESSKEGGLDMANLKSKTIKADVSKTPSSKTDLADATNSDKTAEVTGGEESPSGETSVRGQEPKPSTEMAPVLSADERQVLCRVGAKMLTSVQIAGTVANSCPDNKAADLALKHGAQGLVDEFAPTDAVESTLAPVIVGIRNAVMTGLRLATKGSVERRDIELQAALKGAGVLADLVERFDSHRGYGRRRVTVGNVNVESGAQAIVGNVEATSSREPETDSTIEPKKPRRR